jgi:DNA invertase Pin-like site-specific DNA recombinase
VGGREGEGFISPDVQREAIASYADDIGGTVEEWFEDQDFSGGTMDRPGFQAALELCRQREVDGLIVMRIDRFARSTADGAVVVRELIERDQVFASCHERIDPRTPEGTYMLNAFLNNAELFLNQSRAGWKSAKARAIARGAHIGPTPVGYLKVEGIPTKPTHISPVDAAAIVGGQPGPGTLVPDPAYSPAIAEVFQRAAEGVSALARMMNQDYPHRDGRIWQPSEIRRWLRNRVYLGEVKYGDLVNADAHKPLTDALTWEAAQTPPGTHRRASSGFLLSGLIRCASCRASMAGQSRGGASGDIRVYRCGGRYGCKKPSVITAERIEGFVTGEVRQYVAGLQAHASDDLAPLEAAYREADAELDAFAKDLDARKLLGDEKWSEALKLRTGDREAKLRAWQDGLRDSSVSGIGLEDLDEAKLGDLVRGMVRFVFVRRAPRGSSVEDRVGIVWSDDDRDIPVITRKVHGPVDPFGW